MGTSTKPTTAFWIIAILGLLWNLVGANQYVQQAYKTKAFTAMYTPEQLELINNMPAWATAAFALAVFGGVFGCLLLLLKRKQAVLLFQVSLLGIIVQTIYNFFIADALDVYGSNALIMPVLVFIIAVFLLSYAKGAAKNNVIH